MPAQPKRYITLLFPILLCFPRICAAQHRTEVDGFEIAGRLHSAKVLTDTGRDVLLRRVRATVTNAGGQLRSDSKLWYVRNGADTSYEVSRASILIFLQYHFAGELWYRAGRSEEIRLMKKLGIYRTLPADRLTDSVAWLDQLEKLREVSKIDHPGKRIEASIEPEDPAPPGWNTVCFPDDSAALLDALGHGVISPSISVYGKTRSRLVKALLYADLIDESQADRLLRQVASHSAISEQDVIGIALGYSTRRSWSDGKSGVPSDDGSRRLKRVGR